MLIIKEKGTTIVQREYLILKILEKGEYITSKKLAYQLNVSEKTIQKTVGILQKDIKEFAQILSKTGMGYQLKIISEKDYIQFLKQFDKKIPQNTKERQNVILKTLLSHSYIKLKELENNLFVSKKTISNDIKELKKYLEKFKLSVISKPHYGLKLVGNETDIRFMMLMNEEIEVYPLTESILNEIDHIINNYGNLASVYRTTVYRVLSIAITRSRLNHYIETSIVYKNDKLNTLSKFYDWHLTDSDISHLIVSIQSFTNTEKRHVIDQTHSIKKGLEIIEASFGIDFQQDKQFVESLTQHIQKLEERMRSLVLLKNPLLNEIKQNLKNEYVMASMLASVLEKDWGMTIQEDEIGFLSIIFGASTPKIEQLKKHLLIVCSDSKSGKNFLQTTYQKLFERYVHTVTVCTIDELKNLNIKQYDYVVSTVLLPDLKSIKPHYVSYFLDDKEKEEIKRQLAISEIKFVDSVLNNIIFTPSVTGTSKENIVQLVCKKVEKNFSISLYDKVINRLLMGTTQIGENIALLHPSGGVDKNFISISVLEKPVYWERSPIQIVCLIALPKINQASKLLYQILSTFMIDTKYVHRLIQNPSKKTLQAIFLEIKEKELSENVY